MELDTTSTIGWIGAGRMGSEMIGRLLDAGYQVSVYNRTRAKASALLDRGAKIVESVGDLSAADAVFVTVSSSEDFVEVMLGDEGLLSRLSIPSVVVDSSTVAVEASEKVREAVRARGSMLLAAPVSGNPRVAAAGKLTMAVSGPAEAYKMVAPLLDAIGNGSTYVGDGDLARLVKLCHNLFLGVVMQSVSEITVLAERGGVNRATFLSYLNKSVMGSMFTGYKAPAVVNLDFEPTFTSKLLRKDFDLGLAAARALEVPMPVAGLVHQLVQQLVGEGYGDDDFATLIKLVAQGAHLQLVSENVQVNDGLS
ncbi:NAD(P)-dependent oxidoreductase [Ferrimicrobium sp.]|uniref:NAD(P)-dependent oxidoreductase n=1 Tax=Ferrimicrobium sp. TaxID=2926050 RepID=UPI00344B6A46